MLGGAIWLEVEVEVDAVGPGGAVCEEERADPVEGAEPEEGDEGRGARWRAGENGL